MLTSQAVRRMTSNTAKVLALELAPTLEANGCGSPCLTTGLKCRLQWVVSTGGPEVAASSKPRVKARIRRSAVPGSSALPYGGMRAR